MTTEVTLTIADETYRRAQRIAQQQQQNVQDVLAEAIRLAEIPNPAEPGPAAIEEAIAREITAYQQMHPDLQQTHAGQYVAIYQGKLLDHDTELAQLYHQVFQKFPDEFVLLRRVQSVMIPVYQMRSPRLVPEKS